MNIGKLSIKPKYLLAIVLILFAVVVAVKFLVPSPESQLKGTWVQAEASSAIYVFAEELEFYDDHECSYDGLNGKYKIDDGKLRLTLDALISRNYAYSISGNTLTLTTDGEYAAYIKQ